MKYDAIVVGSGKGERAKLGFNKVFFKMPNNKTVLENAYSLFINDKDCEKVIVVTNKENLDLVENNEKIIKVIGGETRQDSVNNGLQKVTSDYVLIHDGARPYLTIKELNDVKKELEKEDGVLLVLKEKDTIKYSESNYVDKTINRDFIYRALTPQGFKTSLIKEAYENIIKNNIKVTDDAEAFELNGNKVKLIIGDEINQKLTNPNDFIK